MNSNIMIAVQLRDLRSNIDAVIASFENTFEIQDFHPKIDEVPILGLYPTDIYENEQFYELHVDAPGFTVEEIKVEYTNDILHISGDKGLHDERINKNTNILRKERHANSFKRSFKVPDGESVTASLDKGVLKVIIKKKEPKITKRITINAGHKIVRL